MRGRRKEAKVACVICGRMFVPDGVRKYTCSDGCAQAKYRKYQSERHAELSKKTINLFLPSQTFENGDKTCVVCGQRFSPGKNVHNQKACSPACKGILKQRGSWSYEHTAAAIEERRRLAQSDVQLKLSEAEQTKSENPALIGENSEDWAKWLANEIVNMLISRIGAAFAAQEENHGKATQ